MCPSMDNHTPDHHPQDQKPHHLTLSIPKPNNHLHHRPITPSKSPPSISLEIRLFYVRISPCVPHSVPDNLTLRLLRGTSLSLNNSRVPTSDHATSSLRRDRLDEISSEVTYVSTDNIRVTGGLEFEVSDNNNDLLICGSLEVMMEESSGWSMDCYPAGGTTSFIQPKMGISSPCIEVYVAGRWADVPVILTKMVNLSPRKKVHKYRTLDVIPEVSDEVEKDCNNHNNKVVVGAPCDAIIRHRTLQLTGNEEEYDAEGKMGHNWYPEDVYIDEDGQLTWFNAGVRVGVGIGLGMCLGLGIGVGLLMRSYQTTTRNIRRRFF